MPRGGATAKPKRRKAVAAATDPAKEDGWGGDDGWGVQKADDDGWGLQKADDDWGVQKAGDDGWGAEEADDGGWGKADDDGDAGWGVKAEEGEGDDAWGTTAATATEELVGPGTGEPEPEPEPETVDWDSYPVPFAETAETAETETAVDPSMDAIVTAAYPGPYGGEYTDPYSAEQTEPYSAEYYNTAAGVDYSGYTYQYPYYYYDVKGTVCYYPAPAPAPASGWPGTEWNGYYAQWPAASSEQPGPAAEEKVKTSKWSAETLAKAQWPLPPPPPPLPQPPPPVENTDTQVLEVEQTEVHTEEQKEAPVEAPAEAPAEVQAEEQAEEQKEAPVEAPAEVQAEEQAEAPEEAPEEAKVEAQTEEWTTQQKVWMKWLEKNDTESPVWAGRFEKNQRQQEEQVHQWEGQQWEGQQWEGQQEGGNENWNDNWNAKDDNDAWSEKGDVKGEDSWGASAEKDDDTKPWVWGGGWTDDADGQKKASDWDSGAWGDDAALKAASLRSASPQLPILLHQKPAASKKKAADWDSGTWRDDDALKPEAEYPSSLRSTSPQLPILKQAPTASNSNSSPDYDYDDDYDETYDDATLPYASSLASSNSHTVWSASWSHDSNWDPYRSISPSLFPLPYWVTEQRSSRAAIPAWLLNVDGVPTGDCSPGLHDAFGTPLMEGGDDRTECREFKRIGRCEDVDEGRVCYYRHGPGDRYGAGREKPRGGRVWEEGWDEDRAVVKARLKGKGAGEVEKAKKKAKGKGRAKEGPAVMCRVWAAGKECQFAEKCRFRHSSV